MCFAVIHYNLYPKKTKVTLKYLTEIGFTKLCKVYHFLFLKTENNNFLCNEIISCYLFTIEISFHT